MKCTKLLKYISNWNSQGTDLIVKWRIVNKVKSKVSPNCCTLCLTEKGFFVEFLDDLNLLNKRSELVGKCMHQKKLLLYNVKRNGSMD